MSKYRIQKDVPIPSADVGGVPFGSKHRKEFSVTLLRLEIGDSFFDNTRTKQQALTLCYMNGKRHDKKFTIRGEKDGQRIWRTE